MGFSPFTVLCVLNGTFLGTLEAVSGQFGSVTGLVLSVRFVEELGLEEAFSAVCRHNEVIVRGRMWTCQ